jgi:outer membrane immunogenic protein
MKKLLIAATAAAALYSAPTLAEPPSVFNWSGFYIGVNGGELSSKTKGVLATFPVDGFMPGSVSVGTAGLHGGFQGQWGSIVAGVEGGFNAALSDKFGSTPPSVGTTPCFYGSHTCDGRTNDLLTVGGRLGWALNNLLFYGSGGFAYGGVEVRGGPFAAGSTVIDDSTTHHSGWYGGAGIEYALMNNLTVGVDWKHFELGHSNHQTPQGGFNDLINVNDKGDVVTARLTIKGGG